MKKWKSFNTSAERQTDFVAYRGAICNQKGFPLVNLIKGKLYTKNQGPKWREKKVISI